MGSPEESQEVQRVDQLQAGPGHEVRQVHARLQADPQDFEEWKVQAGDHCQQHPPSASPRSSTTPCWPRLASTTTPATTMSSGPPAASTSESAPSPSPTLGTATSSGPCLALSQRGQQHRM